jgi:hypothetical protein
VDILVKGSEAGYSVACSSMVSPETVVGISIADCVPDVLVEAKLSSVSMIKGPDHRCLRLAAGLSVDRSNKV